MYRKRIEKTNWKMQNVNPQGKDCNDCVFRAIAGGTGISWKDTFAGLCQTGLSLHAMPDYPIVFRKYLKEIGARYGISPPKRTPIPRTKPARQT